jgi:Rieske 2Fe-2S family protein
MSLETEESIKESYESIARTRPTLPGRSNLPALPGLTEKDIKTYFGAIAFPNLILNFHSDHVMTYRLQDIAPERTTIVSEFLFEPNTIERGDFDPEDIVDFWDLVSRQDWAVCERVQKGVRSRAYQSGVYPPNDQYALEFNQRYLQARDTPR